MHATGSRPADRYTLSMCNVHCEKIQLHFWSMNEKKNRTREIQVNSQLLFRYNSKSMKTESNGDLFHFVRRPHQFVHRRVDCSSSFDITKKTLQRHSMHTNGRLMRPHQYDLLGFTSIFSTFRVRFVASTCRTRRSRKTWPAGWQINSVSYRCIDVGREFGFLEWAVIITDNLICN